MQRDPMLLPGAAPSHIRALQSLPERRDTLRRRAVREGLGHDPALGALLDAVVADCLGGGEAFFDIAGLEQIAFGR